MSALATCDDVVKFARRGGRVFTHRPGEHGATLAVLFEDGRVEVFALDIHGGLTARPSGGDGARACTG